jgi:hypothetical protein
MIFNHLPAPRLRQAGGIHETHGKEKGCAPVYKPGAYIRAVRVFFARFSRGFHAAREYRVNHWDEIRREAHISLLFLFPQSE